MIETVLNWLQVGLLIGLIYAPITLGLSWTFRLMNYPDLTCEGSFMLSGAVSIAMLNLTGNLGISIFCGILSAGLAGCLTALLHVQLRISRLLSGIVSWAILYSITIRVLGGLSNLSAKKPTLFTKLNPTSSSNIELMIAIVGVALITGIAIYIANIRWGRITRAFGDQQWFSVGLGFSPKLIFVVGLFVGNSLIGTGGVLVCHFKGVFDINMSTGVLIAGLASLVMGEAVFSSKRVWQHILTVICGTIIYNLAIGAFYYDWGIGLEKIFQPSDVRLVSGLMLLIPAALVARKRNKFKLFASEW